jgi:hypothetical protein
VSSSRKVIIHVGQTKAGSTSIQNHLDVQHDALICHGVLFPRTVLLRRNPFDKSRTPGHLLLLSKLMDRSLEDFEREISAHPECTLILSIEGLISDQPDDALEMLGAYFTEWDVEVVAVLRPQFEWARSRYIEDIMSGFRRAYRFPEFVRMLADKGALDYHTRLQHAGRLLGARRIRAIPFYDPAASLLERFLNETGIPILDRQAVSKLHSNRGEKAAAQIEVKRRLNFLCAGITVNGWLDLDYRFRRVQLPKDLQDEDEGEFLPQLDLSESDKEKLRQGNNALVSVGIMDTLLDLGHPGTPDGSTASTANVDWLFARGLELAAKIMSQEKIAKTGSSLLHFSPAECLAIHEALSQHPVSFHLWAPGTAVLAACVERRLVRLFVDAKRTNWRLMDRLDRSDMPSMPVAIHVDGIQDCLVERPYILVAGAAHDIKSVRGLISRRPPDSVVLFGAGCALLPVILADGYTSRAVESLVFLERKVAS